MDLSTASAAAALGAAAIPGLLGFGVSRTARLEAGAARRLATAAALASGALAAGAALAWALAGPGGFGIALIDGLTVLMLATVVPIGIAVVRFSERYLDGDPAQARFCQWLSYTLSAVLLLIVSSNLLVLLLGWVGTSHGLHRLLLHYGDRPAAHLAARKKFLISRLGDVMLIAAFALVALRFGSLEFSEIFARLDAVPQAELLPIALLLVIGAMTKSAQFPFHTWLPDSMEAPTPVSALMHAGIINAGGFLLIRMSPVLTAAPTALVPLALGGAFTALVGSVVMLSQTDVKRKYAWSTVSQMGFMMLQCGLGAWSAATLHLVGHAFYKGHAFLAAGSAVAPQPPAPDRGAAIGPVPMGRLALGLGTGFVLVGVVFVAGGGWLGVDLASKPGLPVLGSVLALAISQLLVTADAAPARRWRSWSAAGAIGVAIAAAYLTGLAGVETLLGSAAAAAPGTGGPLLALVLVAAFGTAFAVQHRLAGGGWSQRARALYVHAHNGFYLGTIEDRIVSRLWPLPNPTYSPAAGGPNR